MWVVIESPTLFNAFKKCSTCKKDKNVKKKWQDGGVHPDAFLTWCLFWQKLQILFQRCLFLTHIGNFVPKMPFFDAMLFYTKFKTYHQKSHGDVYIFIHREQIIQANAKNAIKMRSILTEFQICSLIWQRRPICLFCIHVIWCILIWAWQKKIRKNPFP